MGRVLRLPHIRKLLKNGARNQGVYPLHFVRAHIQLAGNDLTNNHTFKLLSGLLWQTLYEKNIAPRAFLVNPKTRFYKKQDFALRDSHKTVTGTVV